MRQGHAESWTMFPGLDPISVLKYVLMASCMLPCLLSITPQHVKNCQHLPFVDEEIKAKRCYITPHGHSGSMPGLGRSPGIGYGNPFQYSCLENPMDRGP